MNAFPPIPPLDAKAVKSLVRMIRVLRYDHPHWSDDEVASEFETQQRWLAREGRPAPYLDWLEMPRWRAGFDRALALASRVDARRMQEKALRQRWKEVLQDRQPSTPAQQRYVKRLAKRHGEALERSPEAMSKLAASRLIQHYLDAPPPSSPST